MENMMSFLLEGAWTALKLALLTLAFSLPLGLIVAWGRMSRFKLIQYPVRLYQLIMRGTPLMLQLLVVYFGPYYVAELSWDRFTAAVVAFSINYAAYFAEIYRGGIESIPKGQYEAGAVLGFSRAQTFYRIVLPQVVKRILPPMGSEFMVLVKDTALANTIGVMELLRNANSVMAREFSILPLVIAGLIYLILNTVVERLFSATEKRLSYYE
ncbi:MAG: amino acid ABC transporter permease [Bacillota bacterium]